MRIKLTAPLVFTEKDVAKIVRAITVDTCPHRIALFPRVLREWGEIDVMNRRPWGLRQFLPVKELVDTRSSLVAQKNFRTLSKM
jgi:hypothetical protein